MWVPCVGMWAQPFATQKKLFALIHPSLSITLTLSAYDKKKNDVNGPDCVGFSS